MRDPLVCYLCCKPVAVARTLCAECAAWVEKRKRGKP